MKRVELCNRKGQKIIGLLAKPKRKVKGTAVVQHGWSGQKEQAHIIAMQEVFLENGWQTFNFDATNSFNESDGDFPDARLGLHYEDMEDVCQWVRRQDWFVPGLAVSGHSMGGYAAARYGEDHPEEVQSVAAIAPVVSGNLFTEAIERDQPGLLAKWKTDGIWVLESSSRRDIVKRAPYAVYEELQRHDLLPNAARLTMPVFLFVGSDDASCPPDHVRQLFDAIPHRNKVFEILKGAPHTYTTEHDLRCLKNSLSKWLYTITNP
ncbi:hypothetical protein CSA80_02860 [Candidatus Saccharibacteria bacterium]|nr:MAG: hypothetical protein CSA80_02860 [Candidatus Saccharibacteria bacterium]